MKVLHVTPSFYPATEYGGPTYSGYALCNSLVGKDDIELRVLTTDSSGPAGNTFQVETFPFRMPQGYDVFYCRRVFGADIAPGLFWRLPKMIAWADIVHLTAIYSPPTIPTLFWCRLTKKPVVWSARGALQRWKGTTRINLKAVWDNVCNRLCEPQRVALHFTSEEERSESVARISNARPLLIPNGVDVPRRNGDRVHKNASQFNLLYMGRLHPIKGVENLLRAIARVDEQVKLSVCGEGQADYQQVLRNLATSLKIDRRVTFNGYVDGETKERQFRQADVCIVPSFKENFCMVVAESLARSLPVIVSKEIPWKELEARGCGIRSENDEVSLAGAITRAREMPLVDMGIRGREWMELGFSWSAVSTKMSREYRKLIEDVNANRVIGGCLS